MRIYSAVIVKEKQKSIVSSSFSAYNVQFRSLPIFNVNFLPTQYSNQFLLFCITCLSSTASTTSLLHNFCVERPSWEIVDFAFDRSQMSAIRTYFFLLSHTRLILGWHFKSMSWWTTTHILFSTISWSESTMP